MAEQNPTDALDEQGNAAPWLNGRPFTWEEKDEIGFFSRKLQMDNEACRAVFEEKQRIEKLHFEVSQKARELDLVSSTSRRIWVFLPFVLIFSS